MCAHRLPAGSALSRRGFLSLAGASGAVAALYGFSPAPAWASPRFSSNPFTLGVASGDPTPDGVVLWTRLAPEPLAPDGAGGMPAKQLAVAWQVATDEKFANVVKAGTETAVPELAHSVHAEVGGLRPGRDYFYRFRAGDQVSPVGRTRTAPAAGSTPAQVSFALASCQAWAGGRFAAYRTMAAEDLDLVVHVGDYLYERSGDETLADFRTNHARYKTSPDLQAAHAAFPFVLTFDDHEVENNWAAGVSQPDNEASNEPSRFLQLRANAFQAYYEHLPLRRPQRPSGPDISMYRRLAYGGLATFHVLDTRQYRSDQLTEAFPGGPQDPRVYDASRTFMGDEQERWLFDGMKASGARWNVVAQQTIMAQVDYDAGPGLSVNHDQWDGYAVSRNRFMSFLEQARPTNPVVLSGDWHSAWVNDLRADFDKPETAGAGHRVRRHLDQLRLRLGRRGEAGPAQQPAREVPQPRPARLDALHGHPRRVALGLPRGGRRRRHDGPGHHRRDLGGGERTAGRPARLRSAAPGRQPLQHPGDQRRLQRYGVRVDVLTPRVRAVPHGTEAAQHGFAQRGNEVGVAGATDRGVLQVVAQHAGDLPRDRQQRPGGGRQRHRRAVPAVVDVQASPAGRRSATASNSRSTRSCSAGSETRTSTSAVARPATTLEPEPPSTRPTLTVVPTSGPRDRHDLLDHVRQRVDRAGARGRVEPGVRLDPGHVDPEDPDPLATGLHRAGRGRLEHQHRVRAGGHLLDDRARRRRADLLVAVEHEGHRRGRGAGLAEQPQRPDPLHQAGLHVEDARSGQALAPVDDAARDRPVRQRPRRPDRVVVRQQAHVAGSAAVVRRGEDVAVRAAVVPSYGVRRAEPVDEQPLDVREADVERRLVVARRLDLDQRDDVGEDLPGRVGGRLQVVHRSPSSADR